MAENEDKSASSQSRRERRMLWWSKQQKLQEEEEASNPAESEPKKKNDESVDALAPSETKGKQEKKKKNKFYVLFVGQIPYTATTEDVTKHFDQAGNVKSVRLATDKTTGKSRGFGYVEFGNNKSYMRGLAMHLSKIHGRPVNVEITSPGRGTSLFRKENLKRKNVEMARFRGIIEEGSGGGALCIPAKGQAPQRGNKKRTFNRGKR